MGIPCHTHAFQECILPRDTYVPHKRRAPLNDRTWASLRQMKISMKIIQLDNLTTPLTHDKMKAVIAFFKNVQFHQVIERA